MAHILAVFFIGFFIFTTGTTPAHAAEIVGCNQISLRLIHVGNDTTTAKIFIPHVVIPQSFVEANPNVKLWINYENPGDLSVQHEFGTLTPQEFRLISTNDLLNYFKTYGLTNPESAGYTTSSLNFYYYIDTEEGVDNPCEGEATYSPSQLYVWPTPDEELVPGDTPNPTCSYTVTPQIIKQGSEGTTVMIGLDPNGPRKVCPADGLGTECFEIYTCNESPYTVGDWCHTNTLFPSEGLSIVEIEGQPFIQSITTNLQYPRHFWLEYVYGDHSRNNNICPGFRDGQGPRVDVVKTVCDSGWVTVQNAGDPSSPRVTEKDTVRIVYNADKTHGFRGGFGAGWGIPDGDGFSQFERIGDLYGRLNDPQERLDSAFGSTYEFGPLPAGQYEFAVVDANIVGKETYCEERFNICPSDDENCVTTQRTDKGDPKEAEDKIKLAPFAFCNQVPGDSNDPTSERGRCVACLRSGQSDEEGTSVSGTIYTAFGCIRTDQQGLLKDIVKLLLGVAGMVALLAILAGSFQYTTSQGDSNKVKQAKELITAAITGLFFMIFSIIILDFVGVQLFRIPGLSGEPTTQSPGPQPNDQCVPSGSPATGGKSCCAGLIPNGESQICQSLTSAVTFGTHPDGPSTGVCFSSSDSSLLEGVDSFATTVTCESSTKASCSGFTPVVSSTLGAVQPAPSGGFRRCSSPVNAIPTLTTAISTYLDQKIGSPTAPHPYTLDITERNPEIVQYYDAEVSVDHEVWNTLFPDVQAELLQGNKPQLQLKFTTIAVIRDPNGQNTPFSTQGIGYVTILVTVVDREG